ncbi:hypothetical protein, partial [Pseudogemmobacter humi]|uniref:hypothetical protein n=1 Tax=Pseudogemmobacter humi TaxID=2483812 RepID=UPI0018EF9E5F
MSAPLSGFIDRIFSLPRAALMMAALALAPLPLPHHAPAHAQTAEPAPEGRGAEEGFSLIEEGAKLLLRGLMAEMEPKVREMEEAFRDLAPQIEALGPQLREIARLMGDVQNYHMPEVLENGDILIRRKTPLAPGARPPH